MQGSRKPVLLFFWVPCKGSNIKISTAIEAIQQAANYTVHLRNRQLGSAQTSITGVVNDGLCTRSRCWPYNLICLTALSLYSSTSMPITVHICKIVIATINLLNS
jgi:hypothetical protein